MLLDKHFDAASRDKVVVWFLWLHRSRLTRGVMFSTSLFIHCLRPSLCSLPTCERSILKNRFCCKLAQVVCRARAWNAQLWRSKVKDQRSRSQEAKVCQTGEDDILKVGEPILVQIGTSGPWAEGIKWSTLGSKGQRSRSQEAEDRFGSVAEVSFWTPRVNYVFCLKLHLQ